MGHSVTIATCLEVWMGVMRTCHESNQKLRGFHSNPQNPSHCCFPSANVHLCSRLHLIPSVHFRPFFPSIHLVSIFFAECSLLFHHVCLSTLSHLLLLSTSDNCSHFTLFSYPFLLYVISSTSLLFWALFGSEKYFF